MGHPHEKGMQNALDEMKFYTLEGSIKILGSYLRNIPTKFKYLESHTKLIHIILGEFHGRDSC